MHRLARVYIIVKSWQDRIVIFCYDGNMGHLGNGSMHPERSGTTFLIGLHRR